MRFQNTIVFSLCIVIFFGCSQQYVNQASNSNSEQQNFRAAVASPGWYKPANMDTVTIATWNVEHFVDSHDNPYIDNDRENKPPAEIEQRRELLAEAIKKLDADVVVFQELESDSYLQQFAEKRFPEMGYEVFAALESPDWYMNVVMMSRIPLGVFHSYAHVNTPIPGQTDDDGNPASQTFLNNRMWTAELLVNANYAFTLTGLHLKAGRGDRNESWRMGQIQLLRQHFQELINRDPSRNMMVAGDLNMTSKSDEFKALLGDSAPQFYDPLAGTGSFSHPSDSLFWRIDHILPNQNMQPEMVPKSVNIARPLSIEKMIQISDHLPVIARFVPNDQ